MMHVPCPCSASPLVRSSYSLSKSLFQPHFCIVDAAPAVDQVTLGSAAFVSLGIFEISDLHHPWNHSPLWDLWLAKSWIPSHSHFPGPCSWSTCCCDPIFFLCLFCLDFYAYPGSFHSLSCSQLPPCSDGSWISTCVQSFLLSSSPCYPTFFWIFLPQLQHAHNQAQLSSKSVSSFFFHI